MRNVNDTIGMEIELITGTMGTGKSKYIIDQLPNFRELYGDSVLFLKHKDRTIDGCFIVSRAYPDKKIECKMVDDLFVLLSSTEYKEYKCIVVDEYQFFSQENIRTFLINNRDKKLKVIFAGLKYYANGEVWESYNAIVKICQEQKINLKEQELTDSHRVCEYSDANSCAPKCGKLATRHMLREDSSKDFGNLDLKDYIFYCEKHFVEEYEKRKGTDRTDYTRNH